MTQIRFPSGVDPSLAQMIVDSTFFPLVISLRPENDYRILPAAYDAFITEWQTTRSPMIRAGMIRGLLLADELRASKPWSRKAQRQAMLLLDKTIADRAERFANRPPFSLTIPTPQKGA